MYCEDMFCNKEECRKSFFMNFIADYLICYLHPIVLLNSRQVKHVEVLIRLKPKLKNGTEPIGAEHVIEKLHAAGDGQCMTHTIIYSIFQIANGFPFSFAINLDANVINQDLVDNVQKTMFGFAIDPSKIIFEITERKAVNFEFQGCYLAELQKMGFKIALDDFGTGWANIETMEKFDFDIVKIDGRFIRKARESERGLKKLKNICDLIKNHDCKIIAEFIENEEDVLLALSYGIEYGQGYYFSKPVMLTDISAICEKINLLVTTNTDDEPLKVEQAG